MLKNQRHELFAQGLAAGKTADEAYQEAGYTPDRGNASRLTSNDSIRARVAELQARAPRGVALTEQWVIEHLIRNALISMGDLTIKRSVTDKETGQPSTVEVYARDASSANRSLELLGRQRGMFIERKEVGQPGDFDKMTNDELRALVRRETEVLGLSHNDTEAPGGNGAARGKPH